MSKVPPSVLSEHWLPIETIGAECMRERGASSALPPLYFLHVWWARRPLTVSRVAILAGFLPQWHIAWPRELLKKFPSEGDYKQWFLELVGIMGDPVAGRKLIQYANDRGIRLKSGPYGYNRAFTASPADDQLATMGDLLEYAWGTRELSVLDPFAGGGSIPFEALRYGFRTYANELNPVASVILKATLDYPAHLGTKFSDEIRKWGKLWAERVEKRLKPFFPKQPYESIFAYLWARTVKCPYTGKSIPLVPNWWLEQGKNAVALRPSFNASLDIAQFEVIKNARKTSSFDPADGTVRRNKGISPWQNNQAVDDAYIKAESRAGRMGFQLIAVALKNENGLSFRPPIDDDLRAIKEAERTLEKLQKDKHYAGLVPTEPRAGGRSDFIVSYGVPTFKDLFLPRQLLSQLIMISELNSLIVEIEGSMETEKARAISTFLALAFDKATDYNSGQCHWNSTRIKICNTFSLHDFRIRWNPAEFDASEKLVPWVVDQVADAYEAISKLSAGSSRLFQKAIENNPVTLSQGSASILNHIKDGSIFAVCVDPPYYDNVMYSECSDFFYVWLKRIIGHHYPEWFSLELTDKDNETVANSSRFKGSKKRDYFARADYEHKMAAAFQEMHRVLRPDGVLTVMFTHKEVAAWDTLATALIGAGFSIHASWPVQTESENSLHQAKKNAAKSTILLVCRKRLADRTPTWWDDLKGQVRTTAREKAELFHSQGISGVDLYISTFGPVLAVLSQMWPVLSSEVDADGNPRPLKPEVALDLAREEVVKLRKEKLLHGRAVQFDPVTDWYIIAWDAFKAERFPGDEARKLAIVLGLELEGDIIRTKRLAAKKGADVVLNQPTARRKKGMVDPDLDAFDTMLDAVHTAMMVYDEDGARACDAFLKRTGLISDSTFKMVVQALLNTIPRTKIKGRFVRPEAQTLDDLRLKFFDDLGAPPEEVPPKVPTQGDLFIGPMAEDEGEPEDEAKEEDED